MDQATAVRRKHPEAVQNARIISGDKKNIRRCAIVDTLVGTILIILGIVVIAIGNSAQLTGDSDCKEEDRAGITGSAAGIWCGVASILMGLLSFGLQKRDTKNMFIANSLAAFFFKFIALGGAIAPAVPVMVHGMCSGSVFVLHIVIAILCFTEMIIGVLHLVNAINAYTLMNRSYTENPIPSVSLSDIMSAASDPNDPDGLSRDEIAAIVNQLNRGQY